MRCGKRIAKSLPQSIGAWVCGQYDSDRGVARSASEALKQLFPTEEKLASVWRVYLLDILDFCNDAITKETVQTLSDERVTSPDEAIGKYARVVSSAIVALQHILRMYHNTNSTYIEICGLIDHHRRHARGVLREGYVHNRGLASRQASLEAGS